MEYRQFAALSAPSVEFTRVRVSHWFPKRDGEPEFDLIRIDQRILRKYTSCLFATYFAFSL